MEYIVIFFLLLGSAFFSGTEIAVIKRVTTVDAASSVKAELATSRTASTVAKEVAAIFTKLLPTNTVERAYS